MITKTRQINKKPEEKKYKDVIDENDTLALTTYANVNQFLGLNPGQDENLINRLILAASDFIRMVIGRDINLIEYTEVRNGTGNTSMLLGNYPVTAVASVSIDGRPITASINGGQGYTNSDTMLYLVGHRFPKAFQKVVIVYTAGYETVPYQIEQACIDLVALKYKEKDRVGKKSEGIAEQTTVYNLWDLTKDSKEMLMAYQSMVDPV